MSATAQTKRFCTFTIMVGYGSTGWTNASITFHHSQRLSTKKRIRSVRALLMYFSFLFLDKNFLEFVTFAYFLWWNNIFLWFRAVSHITGFVIRQQPRGGCRVGYIAHCDPQGTLPPWLVNKVTHSLGPRMVKDLRKAALGYKKWKIAQSKNTKPWRFPEEIITPRISVFDVSFAYHFHLNHKFHIQM